METAWLEDYTILDKRAGIVDFGPRTQIELSGPDRLKFLHNLCTNEIRQLAVGQGCEALLLNAKGHILFHLLVFHRHATLVLETVAGVNERLANHLNRYLIREQVEIVDRTADWGSLLLVGPEALELLGRVGLGPNHDSLVTTVDGAIGEQPVQIRWVPFTTRPSYQLVANCAALPSVSQALLAAGAVVCDRSAFEALRIEAAWPWAECDLSEKNLPQELNRDTSALHFRKGCYLGQETVARIDALGHVNKYLTQVHFPTATDIAPALALSQGEQLVGEVTSASVSPRLGGWLALAFVRRGAHTPGTQLSSSAGPGVVIARERFSQP